MPTHSAPKSATLLSLLLFFIVYTQSHGITYPYNGSEKIVGNMQYMIVQDAKQSLESIARKYEIGKDALFIANPHLSSETPLQSGTVVYLPHAIIVPAIKPDQITINIAEKRMFYLDKKSQQLYIWPVGVGRAETPTPIGDMTIIHKRSNPTWFVPKAVLEEAYSVGYHDHPKTMPPGPKNPLGNRAIGLSKRSYLIHGTHQTSSIGTRNTAGCINMYPEDISQLYKMIDIHHKVTIINQPIKTYAGDQGIYLEVHPFLSSSAEEDMHSDPLDKLRQAYNDHIAEQVFAENILKSTKNTHHSVDKIKPLLENPSGVPMKLSHHAKHRTTRDHTTENTR